VLFLTIEDKFRFTYFDPEELVDLLVHLVANFLAALQAHHHQLGVLAREEHLAEEMVLFGQFLNVSNETGHKLHSLFL
jgi:hypothetical protein